MSEFVVIEDQEEAEDSADVVDVLVKRSVDLASDLLLSGDMPAGVYVGLRDGNAPSYASVETTAEVSAYHDDIVDTFIDQGCHAWIAVFSDMSSLFGEQAIGTSETIHVAAVDVDTSATRYAVLKVKRHADGSFDCLMPVPGSSIVANGELAWGLDIGGMQ